MSHRRLHLLEKIQVELVAVAAIVAVYVLLAPAIHSPDPLWPTVFVVTGNSGGATSLVLAAWVLAAGCSLVTLSARPEGGMLAALLGAGGVSLHSPRLRSLLWSNQERLPALFGQLIGEVLLLAAALVGLVVVFNLVRWIVSAACPRWVWTSPLGKAKPPGDGGRRVGGAIARLIGWNAYPERGLDAPGQLARRYLSCLGLALGLSIFLLMITMQSCERGQTLFALLISFTLALAIAHQVFPVPSSIVAWLMPVPVAVLFYTLAAVSVPPSNTHLSWLLSTSIGGGWNPQYAQALPIDWVTIGSGGAVLGYWISERIHEAKHFEMQEEIEGG